MLKKIYAQTAGIVTDICVKRYDRVRRGQTLLELKVDNTLIPLVASYNGWVRHIFVTPGQAVKRKQVLLLIDVVEVTEFQPDSTEINLSTELGEGGRREFERKSQRKYGKASGPLSPPPQKRDKGMGHGGRLKSHPFSARWKSSASQKMQRNAAINDAAIDQASNDPTLKMKPSLQQQLQNAAAPSKSPTPTPSR